MHLAELSISSLDDYLGLTNDWLLVMTGDVMEPNSIVIEVVEDGQTEFIPLPVVRLGPVRSSSVRPVQIIVSESRGPSDVATTYFAPSPEKSLSLAPRQIEKLPLLVTVVDGYRFHPIGLAKELSLILGEGRAADSPGQ